MVDKVSIIMPSYNSENYIEAAIKSVLNQTYSNIELIVVDDCSDDDTKKIVLDFCDIDERIKFFELEKNSGVSAARNYAISKSTGNYIAFLDSDDFFHPEKIEKQYNFMKKNNIAFSYTNYRKIDQNNNILKSKMKLAKKNSSRQVLYKMSMLTSTTMICLNDSTNKILFPNIESSEDRACYYDFLRTNNCIAYLIDDILTDYRIHNDSLSYNKGRNAKRTWKFFRKIVGFNIFKSLFYFNLYVLFALLKRV